MSFHMRCMLAVAAIETAFLIILLIMTLGFLNQSVRSEVHRDARINARFAAVLLSEPVAAGDRRKTKRLVQDLVESADLVSLDVRDSNGRSLATLAKRAGSDVETFVQTVPIIRDGKRIGTIRAVARDDFLDEILGRIKPRLVVTAILLLALSGLVSWAFGRHLSRHLRVIRRTARRVSGGDFNVSIPVEGPAEFRAVAKAMNSMSSRIGELHNELRHALADQTHALESTFDHMTEGVAIFDADGRLLARNPTFAALTDIPVDAFEIGSTLDEMVDFHAAGGAYDSAEGQQIEAQCRNRNWEGPSLAFELFFPDGRTISVRRTRLPDGGFIAIHEDVTREREDQRRLLHAAKLATLGELATATAHELNQPLNVIRLSADNARARLVAGKATEDYLEMKFGRIAEQTERAAAIIDHMRIFGRKPVERPEPFDLGEAVQSAVDFFAETARLKGYMLDLAITPGLVVKGHAVLIEQVVANLISNAIAAFRTTDAVAPQLRISVARSDDAAVVEVADNAGGIPPDILPRIFEPFFTTKPGGEGTGLGLSISYGIISDMRGTLSVRNESGGATFSFELPVHERVSTVDCASRA
ncbi:MAG TPA: ATP-binding protein [Bradyrhizobium sp.]|uniref:sensor histidine kinase n=1 Tax=Novosphingobium sp. TaxID=1874826 RepID=UPI002CA7D99D|nr:ATP-binding protein [Bradyrhizobium sp.]